MDTNRAADIKKAIDKIKANQPKRERFVHYYNGEHNLAFATDKFKTAFGHTLKGMRDNLCPIVVDALADRMEVINFGGDDTQKSIAEQAWAIWQRELMELISNETHIEAIKTGCAYMIVWGNDENKAKFYLQDSRNCVVIKDEETDVAQFAAKQWTDDDKRVRLTLYYADRIEKWITQKKRDEGSLELKPEHFVEIEGEEAKTLNPYGVIPMFEFETLPVLTNAIPLQDSLNKTFADRMVSQEFAAFRQRWATGLEPPVNEITGIPTLPFKAGADRLWFTNDEKVNFGEFEATALEPFLAAADADRLEIARVTGTPLHFFSITSDAMSGEALKTLESKFTKKVKRTSLNFGAVWSRAMKLALAIEGTSADNLTVQWDAPEQRSEKEALEAAQIKQELGIPEETLWEELGYTKEDIAKFGAADIPVVNAKKMPNEKAATA